MKMSKYNKLYTALGVLLLMTACQDENFFTYSPVTIGDEVQFGASAYFDVAGGNTRTEYGNIKNGKVALNWVEGDDIEIVSPQSSVLRAVYAISGINIDKGFEDENDADGNSYTTMLRKETDEGIRWGEGYTIYDTDGSIAVDEDGVQQVRMHDFYALYPAIEAFTDEEISNTGVGLGIEADITNNTAVITGYMPNSQNPINEPTEKDGAKYFVEPDMRYAFMAASTSVSGQTRTDTQGNTYEPQIHLEFTPLVTALQFEITAGDIQFGNVSEIVLKAVSLRSEQQQICGGFSYDFKESKVITNVDNPQDFNTITMDFANSLSTSIVLTKGDACNVTFFLLPTDNFSGLKLDITYTIDGILQTKTATIGIDIQPKKKYFFDNLVMPAINTGTSSWLSALDDATYVSQLSIPVAGNAFTYQYSGENSQYHKEQVVNYEELWNMGVRGFEFATSAANGESLGDEYFVCNGAEMKADVGGITFEEAFSKLAELVQTADGSKEFALIICKYQSYGGDEVVDGYVPQTYINQLGTFLTSQNYIETSKIVPLYTNSTVGDLRGKIVVLVRPADEQYLNFVGLSSPTNDYSAYMSVVNDWGSSVDRWNRRYGSSYLTEGAFASTNNSGKSAYEDVLWGISSTHDTFTACNDNSGNSLDGVTRTLPAASRDYAHAVNGTSNAAMVQCFERVAPVAFATPWMLEKFIKEGEEDVFSWNIDSWTRNTEGYSWIPDEIIDNGAVGGGTLYSGGIYGWSSTDNTGYIHTYEVELTFPETETYNVTFQYTAGYAAEYGYNHRINLLGVEVLNDSEEVIVSDYHTGFSGGNSENNTYTLENVPAGTYTVRYYCETLTEGTAIYKVYSKGTITYSPSLSNTSTAEAVSLWLRWPESVSEKKAMIDDLYNLSIATKGQTNSSTIYINSLAGYFITEEVEESYYPYISEVSKTLSDGMSVTYEFANAGSGGDYASCAAEMNWYLYNKIKNKNEGPYGLVMMNYLGASESDFTGKLNNTEVTAAQASEAANNLPYLIVMNNFKFPLAVKPSTVEEASLYLSDKLVDPSQPLQVKWVE